MKTHGSVKTYEPVANLSAMATIVECVKALPDANEVPQGTVFRLIDTQKGYVAMHFYVCIDDGASHSWEDLTMVKELVLDPYGTVTFKRATAAQAKASTGIGISNRSHYILTIRNFMTVAQRASAVGGEEDIFDRDVLVCKRGNFPESVEDGTELFSSTDPNGVTNYPIPWNEIGVIGSVATDPYYYRLFHVFKSGYTTYRNVTPAA